MPPNDPKNLLWEARAEWKSEIRNPKSEIVIHPTPARLYRYGIKVDILLQ
jgi:hypothetical protein